MVCQNHIQELYLCLVISRTNLAAIWSQAALRKKTSLISILNLLPFWFISDLIQGLHLSLSHPPHAHLPGDQEKGTKTICSIQSKKKEKELIYLWLEIHLSEIKEPTRLIFLTWHVCSITEGFRKMDTRSHQCAVFGGFLLYCSCAWAGPCYGDIFDNVMADSHTEVWKVSTVPKQESAYQEGHSLLEDYCKVRPKRSQQSRCAVKQNSCAVQKLHFAHFRL